MTPSRAKQILEGMRLVSSDKNLLYGVFADGYTKFLDVVGGEKKAWLHGRFTPDELEAIALWMRDPEGVTNAIGEDK